MGQSLDCWGNVFPLANCFPQKYLLAAEIIMLTLLTITHFEMYLERGPGSLLAAFSYKVQPWFVIPLSTSRHELWPAVFSDFI